ncbi:phosphate regulon sensor histidine kinase PhoR [Rheinheimera sp. YQF-2]|jgi:two-component system phosphate regulon sensor histidine kinase PhoR|uniref:Phosphate regulon sensor protein PhoR n=1 Tax=Rheinheimera lutimaris TaxID=2740584 RepID=A0A7Y5EJE7_9GAMM|nr:phosphate regulon sensor histidine kinase PhoR [Rheinheimera lutimaris]NRQ43291.1 phosphate regulon sensor histidine kinase PhoR [Rheinheimera lutimaris]
MRQLLSKRKVYTRLFLFYCFIALVGLISNSLLLALLIFTIALLLWHYHHLFLMDKWLWRDRKLSPPISEGIWGHLFEGIYYLQRRDRRKRRELRNVVRRFRDGAEALPEAVVVMHRDWSIIWSNKLAQILVGLHWPGDEGQRLDNLIRHPDFLQYLKTAKFELPIELPSPVNDQLTLEFNIMAYGVEQYLLIVRDITQLKQLEQIRKDFVANVSHELRTPLTVLQGYLEVMDDEHLPDKAMWKKAHNVMLDQTKRMDALVQQLLTLSRIEASARVQFDDEVDVPAMLAQLEQEAQTVNRDKQHKLVFDIDPQLTVTGVTEELRSAFSNLVINAIKYTQNGGDIYVSWQRQHLKAVFSVNDNGPGIAPQHVKRLTERFYRVDEARARNTGGTGLGLAIVKHVLSRHNSRLMIFSEPGKGSSFSFTLPPELVHGNNADIKKKRNSKPV